MYRRLGRVVIAVCEGQKDEQGQYLATELNLKARFDKPGTIQRVGAALASPVDVEEAAGVGRDAVAHAVEGRSGLMVTIVRETSEPYRSRTALVPLEQVANRVRPVPDEFIAPSGNDVTGAYVDYARPLLGGELPRYARLRNTPVPRVPVSSTRGGA